MTTGKLVAWGPTMWSVAISRAASHQRSSQTIFGRLSLAPEDSLAIYRNGFTPFLRLRALSARQYFKEPNTCPPKLNERTRNN